MDRGNRVADVTLRPEKAAERIAGLAVINATRVYAQLVAPPCGGARGSRSRGRVAGRDSGRPDQDRRSSRDRR